MLIFWGSADGTQRGAWSEPRNWKDEISPEDGDTVNLCGGVMTIKRDEPNVVGVTFANGTIVLDHARPDHMRGCIIGKDCTVHIREGSHVVNARA